MLNAPYNLYLIDSQRYQMQVLSNAVKLGNRNARGNYKLSHRVNIKILFCHVDLFYNGVNSIRLYMLGYYKIFLPRFRPS